MSYPFPNDIQELIGARMALGQYASEDDLIRDALQSLAEEDEDLAAVEEAIEAWHAGDQGLPLDEAFAQIRKQFGPW